jgi:hypothetical protein
MFAHGLIQTGEFSPDTCESSPGIHMRNPDDKLEENWAWAFSTKHEVMDIEVAGTHSLLRMSK